MTATNIPVTILYTPGTYGSYFHWALRTVAGFDTVSNPLSFEGNSHGHQNTWVPSGEFRERFFNNEWSAIDVWNQTYKEFDRSKVTVSAHPSYGLGDKESFKELLSTISKNSDHVFVINPSVNQSAWMINNIASKIHAGGEEEWLEHYIGNSETKTIVTSQWGLDSNIAVKDIPRWILREFLSLQLYNSWLDLTGKSHVDFTKVPSNVKVISVSDIFTNTETTLKQATRRAKLPFDVDVYHSKVFPVHNEMRMQQRHLDADTVIADICFTTLNDIPFTWKPLTLVSESLVQRELRERGYEIKCFELDTFPTSSVQLKELIYKRNPDEPI